MLRSKRKYADKLAVIECNFFDKNNDEIGVGDLHQTPSHLKDRQRILLIGHVIKKTMRG